MRFSRARYVILCQQSLVTAAVLAVGLSAAGVRTLDIVPQPGTTADARAAGPGAPGASSRQALADPALGEEKSKVDTAPVTPKVREVSVVTPARTTAPPQPSPGARRAPRTTGERTLAKPGVVVSAPEKVHGYATIGVTWKHGVAYDEDQIAIMARTETKGVWSKWAKVDYHDDHGPDADTGEASSAKERPGTDALIVGDVDRVQMRAQTTTGALPPDLKLAIIDPGTGDLTKQAPAIDTSELPAPNGQQGSGQPRASGVTTLEGEGVHDQVSLSAMTRPAKPRIWSRAQWGANEKMRESGPPDYGTVKTGFVHHTVNANSYSRAQVPSLLRGIYAYHTQSRGWRDIGYNFLVDRFGRIWEGRYGGVNRAVVGAHTLGYNEVSFAMSAIGNFEIVRGRPAMIAAYTRLFAWKLAIYNIRANNPRINVKGRILHAINGHRDVGQTACPGRYLYARLGYIRTRAREIQLAAQKGVGSTGGTTGTSTPSTTFTSPTQTPRAASAQPSTITFPKSTNMAGTSYPDLILKSRKTGAIRVLPTGGQTGFRPAVSTAGSWWAMNLLAAVGDLTGDGKGDVLARASRTGLTRIYRGDGAGHVAVAGSNATRRFQSANFVAGAGDWNRDGRADVLMRTKTSGSLYLVPGAGQGTFGSPRLLSKAWAGYTSTAVAGDLTGDQRLDIVAVKAGQVYVVPGVAGGGLGAPVQRQALGADNNALVAGARDLSGDGVGDVVVRSKAGALRILTGRSDGTFGPTLGPFSGGALLKLSSGQLAGSAAPDVVGTDASGKRLLVLANNGLVNTRPSLPTNLRVLGATQVLSVGDWNRDGKGDVITRQDEGDTLMLRPGAGNGTFGTGVLMSKGWSTFAKLSAVGDVTGDKLPDLMGKTATGPMTVFPGNGKTSFKAPMLAPASLRTFNQIAVGAWRPGNLPGSAFLSSDGSFVPFAGTTGGDLAGYDWVIGPGDVNANGVADLVVRDTSGTLWLLRGTTKGYLDRRFLAAGYAGYSLGG